jgi:hypothetical protein
MKQTAKNDFAAMGSIYAKIAWAYNYSMQL